MCSVYKVDVLYQLSSETTGYDVLQHPFSSLESDSQVNALLLFDG